MVLGMRGRTVLFRSGALGVGQGIVNDISGFESQLDEKVMNLFQVGGGHDVQWGGEIEFGEVEGSDQLMVADHANRGAPRWGWEVVE